MDHRQGSRLRVRTVSKIIKLPRSAYDHLLKDLEPESVRLVRLGVTDNQGDCIVALASFWQILSPGASITGLTPDSRSEFTPADLVETLSAFSQAAGAEYQVAKINWRVTRPDSRPPDCQRDTRDGLIIQLI